MRPALAPTSRLLGRALVAAAALHAGGLLTVASVPTRGPRADGPERPAFAGAPPGEVDVLPGDDGPIATRGPVTSSSAALGRTAVPVARAAPWPAAAGAADVVGSAPPATPEPVEAAGASDVGGVPLSPLSPDALGIGRANPFLGRDALEGGGTPDVAAAERAVERALREPARARERDLGLGPEGPVLTALTGSTARSTAPVVGRAVIVAHVDALGHVTDLDVADTDGGRAGWIDAARLALEALVGKTLRMPSGARGGALRIELTSAWKLPSGQDPGTAVSILGVEVKKGEGKDSSRLEILNPIPKVHVVELAPDVKLPVVQVELRLLAAKLDPSNPGAQPRRVVHAHLLESTFN